MGNDISAACKRARDDALYEHMICYDCNRRNPFDADQCRFCGSDVRRKVADRSKYN